MIIKQLSAFLENKKGRLFAVADVLAKHGINIRALSLADTAEYGVLRLIVDRPDEGKEVLRATGVTVSVTNVVAVTMPDTPGGTIQVLRALADAGINVEYMYAGIGETAGSAEMVLRTDDTEATEKLLSTLSLS